MWRLLKAHTLDTGSPGSLLIDRLSVAAIRRLLGVGVVGTRFAAGAGGSGDRGDCG